jgi:hypothetical protein
LSNTRATFTGGSAATSSPFAFSLNQSALLANSPSSESGSRASSAGARPFETSRTNTDSRLKIVGSGVFASFNTPIASSIFSRN